MSPAHIAAHANALVCRQFRLPLAGQHGTAHWARVWHNAELLCDYYGVDHTIPCWFAFLHDSQRRSEGHDPEHGKRASEYAGALWRAKWLPITVEQLLVLQHAIEFHSDGFTGTTNRAIEICWDADRLDLGRVNVRPSAERLCTEYARRYETIQQAWLRSRVGRK